MKVPKRQDAVVMLRQGYEKNPGPWMEHSIAAAENAERIAARIQGMDQDAAYVMGLLHDIGRREGKRQFRHVLDGYRYMTDLGYEDCARICLTHSFPLQDVNIYFGEFDCTLEEKAFVGRYLEALVYDDYDKLIQLCDAISMPGGAYLMEQRLIDVALRHGLPSFTLDKWKACMERKKYFDGLCGCNIYSLFPEIIENTFGKDFERRSDI